MLTGLLLVTVGFYYWISWSPELPTLGGDHAYLLLMADWLSPLANSGNGFLPPPVIWSYAPPLYPLLLGLAGGTSTHIELAHAITITFLVPALIWCVLWARREIGGSAPALALVVIFSLLPVSFFQSFGILTENLYLLLSLLAIWLVGKENVSLTRLYVVAVVVGLAAFTRMVGITLILAFAVYVFLRHRERWIRLSFLSAAPLLSWITLKSSLEDQTGYLWILARILDTQSPGSFLWTQIATQTQGLWAGWIISFDHDPSLNTVIVGSAIGLICLAGTIHRAYLGKFDAIYLVFYLALLLVWPFAQASDTSRFLFVVLPILLLHGLKFVQHVTQRFSPQIFVTSAWAFFLAIALIVFPADSLIYQRFRMGAEAGNRQYANSVYWYWGRNTEHDLNRNRMKINGYKQLVSSWRRLGDVIPKDECVYSVDSTWLMLYAKRRSYYPPMAAAKDRFLSEASACRYFYVASYTRGPYELFYPRNFLAEGQVILIDRMDEPTNHPVIGMLIKLPKKE